MHPETLALECMARGRCWAPLQGPPRAGAANGIAGQAQASYLKPSQGPTGARS